MEYELSLDEPLTLYQAGMRWWLAPKRRADWRVDAFVFSEDVGLSEDRAERPDGAARTEYCDEDCILYTFQDKDSALYYLAMYRFRDREAAVLAESDTAIGNAEVYEGKIYYSTEIVEAVAYERTQGGPEPAAEEKDTAGVCLNRMNLDGSGKETVFEYRYPGTDGEIQENRFPYLSLIYEISGDEIVVEVYIGDEPHPVYRMNSDGSGVQQIGQIPAE